MFYCLNDYLQVVAPAIFFRRFIQRLCQILFLTMLCGHDGIIPQEDGPLEISIDIHQMHNSLLSPIITCSGFWCRDRKERHLLGQFHSVLWFLHAGLGSNTLLSHVLNKSFTLKILLPLAHRNTSKMVTENRYLFKLICVKYVGVMEIPSQGGNDEIEALNE